MTFTARCGDHLCEYFFERFVLPVLATVVTGIVFLNPKKFDVSSRIALLVGVVAFAYLLSHQLHLRNEAIRTSASTDKVHSPPVTALPSVVNQPEIPKAAQQPGVQQSSKGDHSPNINTGDKSPVEIVLK